MKKNQRGEIATIITIGALVVIGLTTIITSFFTNQKKTVGSQAAVACDNPAWVCGDECATQAVRDVFGNDPAKWRAEAAKNLGGSCDKGGLPPTISCRAGKYDNAGGCNDGCCASSDDCPSGQTCDIPNGYCRSGKSCNSAKAQKQTCVSGKCVWQPCNGDDCNRNTCSSDGECATTAPPPGGGGGGAGGGGATGGSGAAGCFHLDAAVDKIGTNKFNVSIKFISDGGDGDIQLKRNDAHVAGWNRWNLAANGNVYTYSPEWTGGAIEVASGTQNFTYTAMVANSAACPGVTATLTCSFSANGSYSCGGAKSAPPVVSPPPATQPPSNPGTNNPPAPAVVCGGKTPITRPCLAYTCASSEINTDEKYYDWNNVSWKNSDCTGVMVDTEIHNHCCKQQTVCGGKTPITRPCLAYTCASSEINTDEKYYDWNNVSWKNSDCTGVMVDTEIHNHCCDPKPATGSSASSAGSGNAVPPAGSGNTPPATGATSPPTAENTANSCVRKTCTEACTTINRIEEKDPGRFIWLKDNRWYISEDACKPLGSTSLVRPFNDWCTCAEPKVGTVSFKLTNGCGSSIYVGKIVFYSFLGVDTYSGNVNKPLAPSESTDALFDRVDCNVGAKIKYAVVQLSGDPIDKSFVVSMACGGVTQVNIFDCN